MIIQIIVALILISIIFAMLGCLCVWKGYVYFTDGFAHSSILISVISAIFAISITYSGILFAILFAVVIFKYHLNKDKNIIISLASNFFIASSLLLGSIFPERNVDFNSILFGDILAVTHQDLSVLAVIAIALITLGVFFYDQIILLLIDKNLAQVMKINADIIEFIFLLALSVAVFTAVKIVGTLMIVSMLTIPTMIAKFFAKTPKDMVFFAILVACIINLLAITLSFYLDLPLVPIMVIIGTICYGTLTYRNLV